MAVEELFSKALHFPVDGEQQPVDGDCVQNAIAFWDRVDGRSGLLISKLREDGQDIQLANWKTLECGVVMRNDQIGDLGLVRAARGEHIARVSKAASRRND
jgi:hypothetical protein